MKELDPNKIPSWTRLDNAGTLYPCTLSKKYAAMFRMTITLKEVIDKEILQKALDNVIKRFPSFRYELKQGLFWYYFRFNKRKALVGEDYKYPMLRINFKENNGFMFRVRYFDKRIAVEYFHTLTDGYGGLTFISTLVGEYLRIKHNIKITYSKSLLDPKEKPKTDEYMDSFYKYYRKEGSLEHESSAYHYKGINEANHILHVITGIVHIDELKNKCKEYNCTITQFISALLLLSLQEIQENDKRKIFKKRPIKVSIPINLRNIYPTNTMRNFSSYANIGIDTKYGHYSFEEIIDILKNEMGLRFTEKRVNAKMSANVKLARNYFVRILPMFIKKYFISMADYLMGDRYCSTTFSNIGLVNLPSEIQKYVKGVEFILGKSKNKPNSCSCAGYKDKIYISFSRKVKEATLERMFFTKLVEMGVHVEVESNGGV